MVFHYCQSVVFLKSLTLKGFKSFADTTVLEMEQGVTVVVGPNGSGKSNVVDAIAWVLGAQAPSAVRSQKMEDVIFNGTSKRSALGRAEVLLTIDNSAGLLPIDFSEITIGRTLFRNGESEYALNGVECRLLDVQDLLSDAGVGRQQHVIVSQGQIDAVLNARPEDRRAIIEEAAGVLKYRKRKERAERRLDGTEANLLRVQDLIREVRRQLRPLERQADAARRHGQIVSELRDLRLYLSGREIAALRAQLLSLATEKNQSGEKEQEIRRQLGSLDTTVMSCESELSARGDSGVSDELVKVEQLRERSRGLSAVLAERQRSMERDQLSLMAQDIVASLEAEAARLRAELNEVESDLVAAAPESDALAAEEAQFAKQRTGTGDDSENLDATTTAASAAAEVRGELRTVRNTVELGSGEIQRLSTRLEQLVSREAHLTADSERLQQELATAEEVLEPLRLSLEKTERRRTDSELALDLALETRADAETRSAHLYARLDAMKSAAAPARARHAAEKLANTSGVTGALIDLLVVDTGWDAAVKAALGELVATVIVSDASAAERAMVALRAGNFVGAVLALDGLFATKEEIANGSQSLRQYVQVVPDAPHEVGVFLDSLFARVGFVEELDQAIVLAMAQPATVIVTRSGDRLSPMGWRIGAADDAGSQEVIQDAQNKAASAQQDLDRYSLDVDVCRHELLAARQSLADDQRALNNQSAIVEGASIALTHAVSDRRVVTSEAKVISDSLEDTRQRLVQQQQRVAELEAILPALEETEAAEFAAAQELGQARAAIESRATLLLIRRKDLDVRIGGLREREQFLRVRFDETERRLETNAQARREAATRRTQIERAISAVQRLSGLVAAHRASTEARLIELQEIRRRQSDEVRQLATRLDEARRARHTTEQELEAHRERSRRVEIDEAEARMRLEATVETLRRDLEVEPAVAEASPMPEVPEGVTPSERARALDRDLRLMGPINPLALEEFTELQKRHEFLEEQLNDVRNTRRELMQIIKAVDAEIQTVFAAAYADVSENFTFLFNMLFPGGKGRLVLTNPNDMLNTGIEVEASPPGKNIKKLSLLSGGERSLTALAYLFAVFRSRPSPFYVMDEVEAALDDVNLHRFLGLVHEFRRDAQLIIVSHQKRTMEAGDCLVGVSMQPGGSSKVVTERATTPLF